MSFESPSDRMLSGFINKINKIHGITDEKCYISTGGVRSQRIASHEKSRLEQLVTEIKHMGLALDGKKSANAMPHSKTKQEENVTVVLTNFQH